MPNWQILFYYSDRVSSKGTAISRVCPCAPNLSFGPINLQQCRFVCVTGGSVAEWLASWTQALKGPGSNRSRDAVGLLQA